VAPVTVTASQFAQPMALSAQDLVNQITASVKVQLQQQAQASRLGFLAAKPRIVWRREGHRIQYEFIFYS
jgi:hypothetical protein